MFSKLGHQSENGGLEVDHPPISVRQLYLAGFASLWGMSFLKLKSCEFFHENDRDSVFIA